eukprot:Platyproteum_vivax@DN6448_c0_g1_i1.p1
MKTNKPQASKSRLGHSKSGLNNAVSPELIQDLVKVIVSKEFDFGYKRVAKVDLERQLAKDLKKLKLQCVCPIPVCKKKHMLSIFEQNTQDDYLLLRTKQGNVHLLFVDKPLKGVDESNDAAEGFCKQSRIYTELPLSGQERILKTNPSTKFFVQFSKYGLSSLFQRNIQMTVAGGPLESLPNVVKPIGYLFSDIRSMSVSIKRLGSVHALMHAKKFADHRMYIRNNMLCCVSVLYQMTVAVDNLHKSDLVHSDIKPENFLFDPTEGGLERYLVELIDFEGAVGVGMHFTANSTIDYLSPQLLQAHHHHRLALYCANPSDDMWALGVSFKKLIACLVSPEKQILFENIPMGLCQLDPSSRWSSTTTLRYLALIRAYICSAPASLCKPMPAVTELLPGWRGKPKAIVDSWNGETNIEKLAERLQLNNMKLVRMQSMPLLKLDGKDSARTSDEKINQQDSDCKSSFVDGGLLTPSTQSPRSSSRNAAQSALTTPSQMKDVIENSPAVKKAHSKGVLKSPRAKRHSMAKSRTAGLPNDDLVPVIAMVSAKELSPAKNKDDIEIGWHILRAVSAYGGGGNSAVWMSPKGEDKISDAEPIADTSFSKIVQKVNECEEEERGPPSLSLKLSAMLEEDEYWSWDADPDEFYADRFGAETGMFSSRSLRNTPKRKSTLKSPRELLRSRTMKAM